MAYTEEEINAVWRKCSEKCVYGNRKRLLLTDYGKTWHIDCAQPLSRGGVDDFRNRLVICSKHHQKKGDKKRQEFEQWLEMNFREKPCG